MPKRILMKPMEYIGNHQVGVMTALLVALVVALIIAVAGWDQARKTDSRIDAAEIADERSREIGSVVTCFQAARSRPLLIAILRGLAARETDPVARNAYDTLIGEYERQPVPGITGAPKRHKCVALANKLDVDYRSYDFDPKTGRFLNPTAQEGR